MPPPGAISTNQHSPIASVDPLRHLRVLHKIGRQDRHAQPPSNQPMKSAGDHTSIPIR